MTDQAVKPSKARTKLVDTATRIFYAEGVNAVGIDRVITEAGVTRATLYRHFPSKQMLVTTYVEEADRGIREHTDALVAGAASPVDAVRAVADDIADTIAMPHFRGCAFLNAAAEFPDPADPVHRAVLVHRAWFFELVRGLFEQIDTSSGDGAGRRFVMLRDGAMVAGCLSDPEAVGRTFREGVEALLP